MANYALSGAENLPGGSLFDYANSEPPFPGNGRSREGSSGGFGNSDIPGVGNYGLFGAGLLGIHFGGNDKPSKPYYQRLANREWAQGNAVLAAYSKLYQPTLDLERRQAADFGDLYRKSANETLAHNVLSNRTIREADLADYMRLGPQLLQARREADPLFSKSYDLASQDLNDVNAPLPANVQRDITEAVRGSQVRRGMGLGGSDAFEEALRLAMSGEEFRNARRDRAFSETRSLLGQYGDPLQSLTGRTASPGPQGANIMAPQVGANFDDLFSYGVSRETQGRNINAAESASNKALIGSIIQGVLGGAGGVAAACWVAREVYGAGNPRWRLFRRWLICRGPLPLLRRYLRHGRRFAAWLQAHPEHKPRVRAWMEAKLALSSPSPGGEGWGEGGPQITIAA